jgi:hypothetical protein
LLSLKAHDASRKEIFETAGRQLHLDAVARGPKPSTFEFDPAAVGGAVTASS